MSARSLLTPKERREITQVIREAIAAELPKALRALCAPAAAAPRKSRRDPAATIREARP